MSKDIQIVIYRAKDGRSSVEVNLRQETLWLSLQQIADLFERDKSVISRHIANIFKTNELSHEQTAAKMQQFKRRAATRSNAPLNTTTAI